MITKKQILAVAKTTNQEVKFRTSTQTGTITIVAYQHIRKNGDEILAKMAAHRLAAAAEINIKVTGFGIIWPAGVTIPRIQISFIVE